MNIIVTGGAGFIGSHVVERFISGGHHVAVVDNLSSGQLCHINKNAAFYEMDIRHEEVDRVFVTERPVAVVHLAAQINIRHSTDDPTNDADVNVMGTIRILELAARHGVQIFIFASSGGAIYDDNVNFPSTESQPTQPLSPYGISKLTGEYYLEYYGRSTGMSCVSLRFSNVYGPRQNHNGESGVVAIFANAMLNGSTVTINGDGRQTRDYLYVGDAVEAVLEAFNRRERGIMNVSTGIETNVLDIFAKLKCLTQYKMSPNHLPAKHGETVRSVLDSSKWRDKTGWVPMVSLTEGLALTVDDIQKTSA